MDSDNLPPPKGDFGAIGRLARQAIATQSAERGKLYHDLCDFGEDINPNPARGLASLAVTRAQIGCKKKPCCHGGSPVVFAHNKLNREFDVDASDQFWLRDITYIGTHEGFLNLVVMIDMLSRRLIGWSMQGPTYIDLPRQAVLMAVWRRKPETKVHLHSPSRSFMRDTLPGGGPTLPTRQL